MNKKLIPRFALLLLLLTALLLSSCNAAPGSQEQNGGAEETGSTDMAVLENGALYRIESVYNGNSMSAYNFGTTNNCSICLYKYGSDLSQLWRAVDCGNGSYALENMSSGLYLSRKKTSSQLCGKTADSAQAAQQWVIERQGDSFCIKHPDDGAYVGVLDNAEGEGAYVCDSGLAEISPALEWSFTKMSDGKGEYPRVLILTGDYKGSAGTPEIAKYNGVYYSFSMGGAITIKMSRDLHSWVGIGTAWQSKPSWLMSTFGYDGIWAPGIYKIGEKYFLYYCVSTLGSQNSAIGVAVNTTLDPDDPAYEWADQGMVIRSYKGGLYNCIDPNIIIDENGQPWLVFGSYWNGIFVRKLDPETGMLDTSDTAARNIAAGKATEASFMIKHGDYYYLFVAKGPMASGYYWAVARSESIFGPFVNKTGSPSLSGGYTRLTEYKQGIEGTGHASVFQDDDGTYYMVSESWENREVSTTPTILHISTIVWTEDGWPVTALDRDVLGALGE